MTESTVIKIKNGKITLPKELQKEWPEGEVVFMRSAGGFLAKSITRPFLSSLSKRLSKAAKKSGITARDIRDAVVWARRK